MLGDGEAGWDDGINYKAISCDKIPDLFLDKLVAKTHFSKFGKITRFILRPSRQSCTVEYETEAQAERALDQAGYYNGHEFQIEYATREVAHVQNTEEWVNPEVQAELDAMGLRQTLPIYRMPTTAMLPTAKAVSVRTQKTSLPAIKSGKSELLKIDTSLRQEYEAILRRPAYTDEEKYRVLDARDKLMRLIRPRQTDIKKVERTKGICPDMCPEKERLMREFQRQVSTFEMCGEFEGSSSSISHQRAIKEYSRSSADQEVPLAHELRPENVLQMTMLYLMHRIMDLCDDPQTSIADWFHFVWDRTRSIRKDITQQELCSLVTVQLVEQCARFHIHCAARLVAEDPSVFDKKINAENLTKCLQSLKYMYHDLRIKGVHCPCEAEFRSYIVLLNLGDSNFLWELKQLPTHIQHSKEIKQAIAFYNALQNNNYVRFFSMIRASETSYLSACILLGYFNKLRWRAMEAINKSHNWRKNAVLIPLTYLTKILGFEDEEAAEQYFTYHGLKCDGNSLLLDRLKRPEIEYSMKRAMNLVESKRIVSVGECVCGHALESAEIFENHVPHDSFDGNGLLKPIAWTADDQLRGEAAEERKRQREIEMHQRLQQEEGAKVQKRSDSPALSLPPIAPPPSIRMDSSIFKVPLASPPISPKQQTQFKTTQLAQKSIDSSIFGDNQFAESKTKLQSSSLANFKFGASQNTSGASNITGSVFDAPAKDTGNFIFKMPFAAAKPVGGSGSSVFGGESFKHAQLPPSAGGFLFDEGSKRDNSDNIFSSAAKSTASIFQQTKAKKPEPMPNDSVFQHFNMHPVLSGFGAPHIDIKEDPKTTFGAVTFLQQSSTLPQAEEKVAKRIAEAELRQQKELERQRELEKEQQAVKKRREEERKHQETLKVLQQRAESITADELENMVATQVTIIAKSELTKYQKLQRDCEDIAETLLDESIAMQLEELVNEEYAMMCHDQLILNRYFARWLRYTRKKQKQRTLMEATPVWVTMDTRAEQTAKLMAPNQSENMQMIKRYRHGEPCNFQLLLWKHPDTPSPSCQSIDIFSVVRAHMARKSVVKCGHMQSNKYFKLVVTLPNENDELSGFESLCNKWLRKYVRRISNDNTSKEEDMSNNSPYICAMERNVALCVRKVSGIPPLTERGKTVSNECDNADAIICLMSCDNNQRTRKRIHHLIKLTRLQKAVPVAFIVYDGQYTDELELSDIMEMESLVDGGKISGYKFFGCLQTKNEFSFVHHMGRALRYVVRESSLNNQSTEALEMQKLQSFLEACLGEELWQRWQQSSEQNPCFAKICTIPHHLVELYNEAVKRVIQITTEDFRDAAELAEELREFVPKIDVDIPLGLEYFPKNWKSARRQYQISRFLNRLLLSPIEEALQYQEVEDWELWLLNYASRCIPNDEETATAASYHSIKALIEQLNRVDLADLDLVARFSIINFLPVMKAIAYAQINAVLKDYIAKVDVNDYKLPNEIIYRRQALEDYQLVPWWLNIDAVEAVKIDYSFIEEQDTSSQDRELADEETKMNCEMFDEIIKQAEEVSRKAEENFYSIKKQTISADTAELSRDLDANLYQFELAKQIGCYDASVVAKETEIENDLEGAVGGAIEVDNKSGGGNGFSQTPTCRKRKHAGGADGEVNEIEEIMARAFNVIEKVEAKHDRAERVCKIAMLKLK